jgi:hypothetical protein
MVLAEFRPKEVFDTFEHPMGREPPRSVIVGPSAAAIGWIPYYSDAAQLPPGEIRDGWKEDPALREVFAAGNRPPPGLYTGPGDLMRDLELNDFRVAIALDQPTVYLNDANSPVLVQFSAMGRIGYTPVRKVSRTNWFDEGIGSSCAYLLDGDGGIHIKLFVRFKLGLAGQVAARWTTGHWPPNATATIDYVIDPESRQAEISFTGTVVPQLTCYVGWKSVHEYRMERMSRKTFESFIHSQGCQDALNRPHWNTTVLLNPPVLIEEARFGAKSKG